MLAKNYKTLLNDTDVVFVKRTGNFSDYSLCKPHVCCGWMDLHDDRNSGVTDAKPFFGLRARFWAEDAYLIVTNEDDEFVIQDRTSEIVVFNGTKPHGLVPKFVAQELLERQDEEGPAYKTFTAMTENGEFPPKLIWDWVELDG